MTGALDACAACGQRLPGAVACANPWCGRADRGWSVVFAAAEYDEALRRLIVNYKYRARRGLVSVLARLLAGYLHRNQSGVEEFDLLVPMPAFRGVGARRAWDPVGTMTAELQRLVGPAWPVAWNAVVKTKETPAMTGRSLNERLSLAEGPLRRSLEVLEASAVVGARVLVVDDVLTDGSTLREVARSLIQAGAAEVAGLVVARPAWRGQAGGWRGKGSRGPVASA